MYQGEKQHHQIDLRKSENAPHKFVLNKIFVHTHKLFQKNRHIIVLPLEFFNQLVYKILLHSSGGCLYGFLQ